MLKKKQVLLVKKEVTYNTDPTPATSANEVLVESFEASNEGLRMVDRPAPKNTLGSYAPVYGGTLKALSINCRYRGSGTIDSPPEISPLLQACGLSETINASTSVVYTPASSSLASCTIWRYLDGVLEKYTGCVGKVQVKMSVGGFVMLEFSMVGHFSTETDVALATPTYDSTVPPVVINGAFAIGGYSAIINALEFDTGNVLAMPPDFNATDGYGQIQITDRKLVGSFDPERVLVATNDFHGDFVAGTSMALATGTLGSTSGNRIAVAMPVLKYTNHGENERDGIATLDMEFAGEESSGDDEVTITCT